MLNSRPELPIPNAAAQTRIVSVARIRLDSWKSVRPFKEIFCDDIWGYKLPLQYLLTVERRELADMRELGVHHLIGFRLNDACRHQALIGGRAYRFVNRLVYSTTAISSISTIASG